MGDPIYAPPLSAHILYGCPKGYHLFELEEYRQIAQSSSQWHFSSKPCSFHMQQLLLWICAPGSSSSQFAIHFNIFWTLLWKSGKRGEALGHIIICSSFCNFFSLPQSRSRNEIPLLQNKCNQGEKIFHEFSCGKEKCAIGCATFWRFPPYK